MENLPGENDGCFGRPSAGSVEGQLHTMAAQGFHPEHDQTSGNNEIRRSSIQTRWSPHKVVGCQTRFVAVWSAGRVGAL
jgi:hypothetical protein